MRLPAADVSHERHTLAFSLKDTRVKACTSLHQEVERLVLPPGGGDTEMQLDIRSRLSLSRISSRLAACQQTTRSQNKQGEAETEAWSKQT